MICPDCSYDNIDGVDFCEECGQSLVEHDPMITDLEDSIARHSVRVLCPKEAVTVAPATPVREAIHEMASRGFGSLLVADESEILGIFTERDVLDKVSGDLTALDRPVSEFMTASPETVTREDSIAYAMHEMDLGGYRHLPVVDGNARPTGIFSVRDILRFLCVRFAELRSS